MRYLPAWSAFCTSLIGLGLIVGGARAEDPHVRFALADEIIQYLNAPGFEHPNDSPTPNVSPRRVYAPARKRAVTRSKAPALQAVRTEPTAPPPHTASQQDWDDCAARSIPACTRLIGDQSQSATDRADAYLFRAGAHLAEADLDGAIGDYSEAIKLAPGNVVAYASRALAYFHKGDQNSAVRDYVVADRLDGKKLAEIRSSNPEIEQIGALARAPPPQAK